jgi:gluconokinase
VHFVYSKGSYDLIWARMQRRADRYMKPNLLAGQFEALEEPLEALTVNIEQPVEQVVEQIVQTWFRE